MSAGLDVAFSKQVVSAAPPQSFNPIAMDRVEGHPVVCSPKQLRLHPALQELGWTGVIDEFNDAARLKDQPVPVPILVTTNGTILAGVGGRRFSTIGTRSTASSIPSVTKKPCSSSLVTINPSADGMRISVFAWR
jgi:hypothetical protein